MDEGRLDVDVLLAGLAGLAMAVTGLSVVTVPVTSTVAVPVLVEAGPHDDVDHDPEAGGDQHGLGLHLVVPSDDPDDGGVDQDSRDHPDHQHRHYRPQHLRPVPAKGHLLTLGPGRHPDGEQGDHEGGEI